MADARRALVTDASRGSALCIVRALGRRGWTVVAADCEADAPAFRSRYAAASASYPKPDEHSAAFVDAIAHLVDEHRIDLVIPVTDDTLVPLAAARERFAGRCHLAVPDPDALATVNSKAATCALAARLGVPTPATLTVSCAADVRAVQDQLRFPLVLKPDHSRHAEDDRLTTCTVTYAADLDDLLRQVEAAGGRYEILLQECAAGDGHGVEILADRGRPLLAFQHRRLAEIPITGGASAWRESVPLDPEMYGHALRLVEALAWTGPIMVEFKRGARPYLMEINGRIWGSLPLAVLSGVDFPGEWAELCLGAAPPAPGGAPPSYRTGVRAYDLRRMLLWIVNVLVHRPRFAFVPFPKRRRVWAALWALLSPRQLSDFAARDDPAPARAQRRAVRRWAWRKLVDRDARGPH